MNYADRENAYDSGEDSPPQRIDDMPDEPILRHYFQEPVRRPVHRRLERSPSPANTKRRRYGSPSKRRGGRQSRRNRRSRKS